MTYIWYSGATDVTGRALQEALGVDGGTNRPQNKNIVIGWGTKTKNEVNVDGVVLNHPNNIRKARNKYEALTMMVGKQDLAANIKNFCKADDVMAKMGDGTLKLPIIGRTNFHQSGKGFWLCLTNAHVKAAISDGAQYFQNYIDIDTEYRLHVCCGEIIYAVKKIENATEGGWINQRKEKINDYAQKNNWYVDDNILTDILKIMFKEVTIPDRIVRSNKRGWKFSSVNIDGLHDNLKSAARKAVEALGLDFGAVDCALDSNGDAWIIEVNTGPGLQGAAIEKWVESFKKKINEIQRPPDQHDNRLQRDNRGRFVANRAVGAAAAVEEDQPADLGNLVGEGLAIVMRNVKDDNEARALLNALMNR